MERLRECEIPARACKSGWLASQRAQASLVYPCFFCILVAVCNSHSPPHFSFCEARAPSMDVRAIEQLAEVNLDQGASQLHRMEERRHILAEDSFFQPFSGLRSLRCSTMGDDQLSVAAAVARVTSTLRWARGLTLPILRWRLTRYYARVKRLQAWVRHLQAKRATCLAKVYSSFFTPVFFLIYHVFAFQALKIPLNSLSPKTVCGGRTVLFSCNQARGTRAQWGTSSVEH